MVSSSTIKSPNAACLRGGTGMGFSFQPSQHRLRLLGRGIPDTEENLIRGFLCPGRSERSPDIGGANDGKFHSTNTLKG
jgi:hypothetical protein